MIAKKREVNPKVRTPGRLEWVTDADGQHLDFDLEGEISLSGFLLFPPLFYNSIVTHIPFHFIRLGYYVCAGRRSARVRRSTEARPSGRSPHRDRRPRLDRF